VNASLCFGISLLALVGSGLAGASDLNPCRLHPTQAGWQVYVDHQNRFCFEYPPRYKVAPAKFAPDVGGPPDKFLGRLTTRPSPAEDLSAESANIASINVFALGTPFRLKDLTKRAPTGVESPPEAVHAAHAEFYYYGRGGGGVNYSDRYFFAIRGRTFLLDFAGPYTESNIPDPVTKKLEPQVLASFHSF
jgi:hypothetical protein